MHPPKGSRLTLGIALIIVLTLSAGGRPSRADGAPAVYVLYTPPAGWKATSHQGTVVLTPPDLPPGEVCMLAVMPGERLTGDFRAWFTRQRQDITKDGSKIIKASDVEMGPALPGVPTLVAVDLVQTPSGRPLIVTYLAAHPADRGEVVAYIAGSQAVMDRYHAAASAFFDSLHFAHVTAAPPESRPVIHPAPAGTSGANNAPPPGALSGLYTAVQFFAGFGGHGSLQNIYYLFFPDGRVYHGLPPAGGDHFDWAAAREQRPALCGRYQVSGGSVTFTWLNGTSETRPIAAARGGLRIGGLDFRRMRPPQGPIAGVYETFSAVSAPAAHGGGTTATSSRVYTFSADGRFAEGAFTGVSGATKDAAGNITSSLTGINEAPDKSGRYRIQGDTIVFLYDDGRQVSSPIWTYDDAAHDLRPTMLNIGGNAYFVKK